MKVEELLKPFPIKEFHPFPRAMLGPGAAIDTTRWFVICVNLAVFVWLLSAPGSHFLTSALGG